MNTLRRGNLTQGPLSELRPGSEARRRRPGSPSARAGSLTDAPLPRRRSPSSVPRAPARTPLPARGCERPGSEGEGDRRFSDRWCDRVLGLGAVAPPVRVGLVAEGDVEASETSLARPAADAPRTSADTPVKHRLRSRGLSHLPGRCRADVRRKGSWSTVPGTANGSVPPARERRAEDGRAAGDGGDGLRRRVSSPGRPSTGASLPTGRSDRGPPAGCRRRGSPFEEWGGRGEATARRAGRRCTRGPGPAAEPVR